MARRTSRQAPRSRPCCIASSRGREKRHSTASCRSSTRTWHRSAKYYSSRVHLPVLDARPDITSSGAEGGALGSGHVAGCSGRASQRTPGDFLDATLLGEASHGGVGVLEVGVAVDGQQVAGTAQCSGLTSALHAAGGRVGQRGAVDQLISTVALLISDETSPRPHDDGRPQLTSRPYSIPAYCMLLPSQKARHLPMVMSSDAYEAPASALPVEPSLTQMPDPTEADQDPGRATLIAVRSDEYEARSSESETNSERTLGPPPMVLALPLVAMLHWFEARSREAPLERT